MNSTDGARQRGEKSDGGRETMVGDRCDCRLDGRTGTGLRLVAVRADAVAAAAALGDRRERCAFSTTCCARA